MTNYKIPACPTGRRMNQKITNNINPKSEILNKFQIRNPNVPNQQFGIWKIGI
jgi:hypothetical protein